MGRSLHCRIDQHPDWSGAWWDVQASTSELTQLSGIPTESRSLKCCYGGRGGCGHGRHRGSSHRIGNGGRGESGRGSATRPVVLRARISVCRRFVSSVSSPVVFIMITCLFEILSVVICNASESCVMRVVFSDAHLQFDFVPCTSQLEWFAHILTPSHTSSPNPSRCAVCAQFQLCRAKVCRRLRDIASSNGLWHKECVALWRGKLLPIDRTRFKAERPRNTLEWDVLMETTVADLNVIDDCTHAIDWKVSFQTTIAVNCCCQLLLLQVVVVVVVVTVFWQQS